MHIYLNVRIDKAIIHESSPKMKKKENNRTLLHVKTKQNILHVSCLGPSYVSLLICALRTEKLRSIVYFIFSFCLRGSALSG